MNAIARAVGYRFFERTGRRWELRLSWAEISGSLGLALGLCMFGEGFSLHMQLGWPNLYIKLPFLQRWHREPYEMMEKWGFSWVGPDAIHFSWGRHTKIVHMPWSWEWVRSSLLMADGTWLHETRMRRAEFPNYPLGQSEKRPHGTIYKIKDQFAWQEVYPYRYVLRSGEVQERWATVRVEEREWRMRWLMGLPWPRNIQRTIDINFNDEVGERSGSRKGGCMGCGFELRYAEMPEEALRRMELTRKF